MTTLFAPALRTAQTIPNMRRTHRMLRVCRLLELFQKTRHSVSCVSATSIKTGLRRHRRRSQLHRTCTAVQL